MLCVSLNPVSTGRCLNCLFLVSDETPDIEGILQGGASSSRRVQSLVLPGSHVTPCGKFRPMTPLRKQQACHVVTF
jgi:hypothetical protein